MSDNLDILCGKWLQYHCLAGSEHAEGDDGMLDGASDGLSEDDMIEGESVLLSMILLTLDGFSDC